LNGAEIRGILAQNIKSFREHRKWSQADLAANSEISIPFLSEIERGNKWPFPDTLAKIARALGVKIHELFWEKAHKKNDFTAMVVKELLAAQKAAADGVSRQYLG
jgi:transcriptional regulator with XRE-family HTH domain